MSLHKAMRLLRIRLLEIDNDLGMFKPSSPQQVPDRTGKWTDRWEMEGPDAKWREKCKNQKKK